MYYFKMYSSSWNKTSHMFVLLADFFLCSIQGHAWLIVADTLSAHYRHIPVLNVFNRSDTGPPL